MKKLKLAVVFIVALLCMGHEFWLEPSDFFTKKDQPVRMRVCVGEDFRCEAWSAGPSRITQFESFLQNKKTNWLGLLQAGDLQNLELRFRKAGTHLVALATNNKYLELGADEFENYLRSEGLERVIDWRAERGQADKAGRELYRREASMLVQVGRKRSPVDFQRTGFDLKIIPQQNPCTLQPGRVLRCRVLWKGKPLAGALVLHWAKRQGEDSGKKAASVRSDSEGWVEFTLLPGANMISLVHMVAHLVPAKADWQSVWASLTFGIE